MKSFYVARCWKGDVVIWEAWSYDKYRLIKQMTVRVTFTMPVLYYVSQKTCQAILVLYPSHSYSHRKNQTKKVRAMCESVQRTQEEDNA